MGSHWIELTEINRHANETIELVRQQFGQRFVDPGYVSKGW